MVSGDPWILTSNVIVVSISRIGKGSMDFNVLRILGDIK
jgi:hypothetical protein